MAALERREVHGVEDHVGVETHNCPRHSRIHVQNLLVGETIGFQQEAETIHVDEQIAENKATAPAMSITVAWT